MSIIDTPNEFFLIYKHYLLSLLWEILKSFEEACWLTQYKLDQHANGSWFNLNFNKIVFTLS